MGKRKKQLGNITHRDGWIIREALAFAIEGLGAAKWPQLSNIEDMKEILAFMLDLDVTETEDGIVLPPNWSQSEALFELGRLYRLLGISILFDAKRHTQVGPLQRGRLRWIAWQRPAALTAHIWLTIENLPHEL